MCYMLPAERSRESAPTPQGGLMSRQEGKEETGGSLNREKCCIQSGCPDVNRGLSGPNSVTR